MVATKGIGATERLMDIDTEELELQIEKLREEAEEVSYRHSAMLVELQGQNTYHTDMIQQLKERVAWHEEQQKKVVTVMEKMGATTEIANGIVVEAGRLPIRPAAEDDPDDHLPTAHRKPRVKTEGGTVKSGVESLLKANADGLTQQQVMDLFLAPKSKGGLEHETKSDKDTFGKTVYNSGLRPLTNEGVLIQMPTGGRNKLYVHRDNYEKYIEKFKRV